MEEQASESPRVFISETDQAILKITVGNRVYREPFSGLILMYHIEGLRKKLE